MYQHYKFLLLATDFLLPLWVLVAGNPFNSRRITLLRAMLAMLLTWVWIIVARIIVEAVDIRFAESPQQLQKIYDGDGAKNAFATVFGWVPASVVVFIDWTMARAYFAWRNNRNKLS
ncbi:MAG: hypothetical protein PHE55_05290 [Methylococcaceae bacterium]|nr:hypothetical protein [Methylococcaceae bacterium]